jgi:3-hydroxybutyryl-CoA dehydrogenase
MSAAGPAPPTPPLAGRAGGPAQPLTGRALVVGGGVMGAGIAARLGAGGVDTTVLVRRAEVAEWTGDEIRRRGGRAQVVTEAEPPFALAVESIAEELDVKRDLLARTEPLLTPDGILATNTSSLSVSALAEGLAHPERFAGWHWFNPAELVPLVEVVGGARTARETIERLLALSTALGKQPVAVRRDVPGFVANRLQYALIREAYALVEEGVCDVEDVDRAVVHGLGARWAAIGPFASMDAAGLQVHEAAAARLFPELSNATDVPRLLRELRTTGATGMRGGRGLRGTYSPTAAGQLAARRDATLALLAGRPA